MIASDVPGTASPAPTAPSADDCARLFKFSLDLLCIAGLDGYFKRVNPAWTEVMGWSEEELLARPVAFFMHPEDRERTLAARANLARGIPLRGLENRYLCKNGSYRWLAWQSAAEVADGTVFAVARDITDRRRLDQEQLVLSKLESTGVLAGGIAHDFNNILGALLLNLDMIALSAPLNPNQQEHLRRAQESIRSAESLTEQLLAFARGGDGARRLCPVAPLLRQSVELALSGSNVRAEWQIDPDVWPVEMDEPQIRQAIRSVALNAREAMPAGGTVCVAAANWAKEAGAAGTPRDFVRITIADDGVGMSPEILLKAFDPYFSTKRRGTQKGMGLGLTICRTVLHKHGGTIQLESRPNCGATVTLMLPATRRFIPAEGAATPLAGASDRVARKILVMDDEPVFRQIVGEAMRRYGYRVEVAANGDEVLALCQEAERRGNPFDVVLLDLTVRAGMGGAETMRLLRDRAPAVRGVLMTGYSSEETFREYARHGFSAALGKPFSADALHAALMQVLQGTPVAS